MRWEGFVEGRGKRIDAGETASVAKRARGAWVVWGIAGVMALGMAIAAGIVYVSWSADRQTKMVSYGTFRGLLESGTFEAVHVSNEGTDYGLTGTVAAPKRGQWGPRVMTRVTREALDGGRREEIERAAQTGGAKVEYSASK